LGTKACETQGELEEHAGIFYWEPDGNTREKGKKKMGVGKSAMENSSTLLDHIIKSFIDCVVMNCASFDAQKMWSSQEVANKFYPIYIENSPKP
jgi:hypothetical protein